MTRALGPLLIALIVVCAGGVAVAQPNGAHWVLANEYPPTSLPGEGDAYFAKAVADRVAGKLVVEAQADAKSGFKSREQLPTTGG
jgi:TRAP-type C4-dicarboxylate transport system substrate-binding protein